ncbi:hypothetical protein ARMSODRAFT_1022898 [Armillaria solidipes]|uniref:Uncharacterized protein n=1 Tax=Armillaria solidipes TaxID=1076256 RepID=A0A2H3BEX8_9AGAR|nr:hypothetical protein ARMSODRAFT_1022898 [Armillaria solidipes]
MNGPSRITRPTLEFPSPLPSHSPALRSVHVSVREKPSRYSDLSPSQPFGHQPRRASTSSLSTTVIPIALHGPQPRTGPSDPDFFFYGYALSRIIPSGSGFVRIHEDESLRAGNGSCRVFLSSLRRRKVNASTSWYFGSVKWERSFLLIKLPHYVLCSIPRSSDFKASSTARS